jgi:hypothetical protein
MLMHDDEIKQELESEPGSYEEQGVNPDPDGRNMTRMLRERVDEIARVQVGHTAQLKEIRSVQAEHTATLGQHTATLGQHTAVLDQHTATLKEILLKVEDIAASSSDRSWEKLEFAATYKTIDRQLRDLRERRDTGWREVGAKLDRVLVHLGVAQGE